MRTDELLCQWYNIHWQGIGKRSGNSYWFFVNFVDLQMGKHVDAYNILISKIYLKVILSSPGQSQLPVSQRLETGKTGHL